MFRFLPILPIAAIAFAASALAQSPNQGAPAPGNPAGAPPGTREAAPGVPAQRQLNQPDRIVIRSLAGGGAAEVELGRLAAERGGTHVREFGQRMVSDHGKANDKLAAIANANGVTLPDKLDDEHQAIHDKLQGLKGMLFDRAYLDAQIAGHQKTAQLLEYEIGSGQDSQLKEFASEILPVVLQHLRMAQDLSATIMSQMEPAR